MGNPDFPKYSDFLWWFVDISPVLCGIIADTDIFPGNIYQVIIGFDNVAAEFLVPAVEFRNVWNHNLKDASRKFKVSELVIARRAHDLGLIDTDEYRQFWIEYNNRPLPTKNAQGGGSFYKTSVKRVGRLLALHIKNAVGNRQLSYTDAYRLTGLYDSTYTQFMNAKI